VEKEKSSTGMIKYAIEDNFNIAFVGCV